MIDFKNTWKRHYKKILILSALLLIVCFLPYYELPGRTQMSPCGKYRAESYSYLYTCFVMSMPGGGSDRSGCVYIRRCSDGRKLARAELPMMWLMQDLQWLRDEDDGGYFVKINTVFSVVLEPEVKIEFNYRD